jgi:hypothetical protein
LVRKVGNFLVVHGGVPASLLGEVAAEAGPGGSVADKLHQHVNVAWREGWGRVAGEQDGKIARRSVTKGLTDVLGSELSANLAYELVSTRGYFGRDGKGCKEVERTLALLAKDGVERIVVGHTPGSMVRIACGG